MNHRRCYLFALEVAPLTIGRAYDELPLHCTLMHRFWVEMSPEDLMAKVHDVLVATPVLSLRVIGRTLLGPKQVSVSLIEHAADLETLNARLFERLNELGVEYVAPQWVGQGHVFHVTDKPGSLLKDGVTKTAGAVYLIEVNVPGYEGKRIPRTKFALNTRKDEKLAKRLLAMAAADQRMRKAAKRDASAWDDGLDKRHTKALKRIIAATGWPRTSVVGERAANAAWLLAQHAGHDREFQARCLEMMKRLKQIEDEANLDRRRAAVGLQPFAEYRKLMVEYYGDNSQS